MNFGQNLYDWFLGNAQPIILLGIVVAAVVLLAKRKFTELLAVVVVAIIAVGFVYNTSGTKDAMLGIYNKVVVEGAAGNESGNDGARN